MVGQVSETVYWSCESCSERGEADVRLGYCPECGAGAPDFQEWEGEPHGAGADPAGRPDPAEAPEFWTE
jgi:hypothetical protein